MQPKNDAANPMISNGKSIIFKSWYNISNCQGQPTSISTNVNSTFFECNSNNPCSYVSIKSFPGTKIINSTTSECVPGSYFIETDVVINECVEYNKTATKIECDSDKSITMLLYQNTRCLGNPSQVIVYHNGSGCNENDADYPLYTEIHCENFVV